MQLLTRKTQIESSANCNYTYYTIPHMTVCVIIRPLLCCGQIYRKSSDTIMGMGLSLGDPEAGEGNILLPGECMV